MLICCRDVCPGVRENTRNRHDDVHTCGSPTTCTSPVLLSQSDARFLQAYCMYEWNSLLALARSIRLPCSTNIIIARRVLLPCRHLVLAVCGRSTPVHEGNGYSCMFGQIAISGLPDCMLRKLAMAGLPDCRIAPPGVSGCPPASLVLPVPPLGARLRCQVTLPVSSLFPLPHRNPATESGYFP